MAIRRSGGKGSTDIEGWGLAKGIGAHAEGGTAIATGDYAHAEGNATTASGINAHAEGSSTTASAHSAHAEGSNCSASGLYSHAEGYTATASNEAAHAEGSADATGAYSHAEGNAIASGAYSHAEGVGAIASGNYSHAEGVNCAASRYAQWARGSLQFALDDDAQANRFTAGRSTTTATPALLTFNNSGSVTLTGIGTNVLTVPINRAHQFRVSVVARRSDVSGDAAGWNFTGVIARGSSGSAAFVGAVDSRAWGSTGAAAWDITLTVNTSDATNNYLAVTATGEASKTIRWVALIETVEVG